MNDIERLKKLNKMIPEMKKHGFADTFDEAARKTEEIFDTKFVSTNQDKAQLAGKRDESSFDKLKQQFETRIANMESDVSNAVSKLNEIVKAINDIEQKLAQPAEAKVQAQGEIKAKPAEVQTNIVKTDAGKPRESDPKNMDFTPDNIDIRKYFNFSNKRD